MPLALRSLLGDGAWSMKTILQLKIKQIKLTIDYADFVVLSLGVLMNPITIITIPNIITGIATLLGIPTINLSTNE